MSNQRNLGAVAAGYAASAAAYSQLPTPDWSGELLRPFIALALPTAAGAIALLLRSLLKRDRVLPGDELSAETCETIASRLVVFIILLHALMLSGLVAPANWVSRAVLILAGFTLIGIGNLLPRTRPNAIFGIRTTRALNSRLAWIRLHLVTGRIMVGVGLGVAATAFLPAAAVDVLLLIPLAAAMVLLAHSIKQADQ